MSAIAPGGGGSATASTIADRMSGLAQQLREPRRLVAREHDPRALRRASARRRRPAAPSGPAAATGSRQPNGSPDVRPGANAMPCGVDRPRDSQVSSSVRDAVRGGRFQARGGRYVEGQAFGRSPCSDQLGAPLVGLAPQEVARPRRGRRARRARAACPGRGGRARSTAPRAGAQTSAASPAASARPRGRRPHPVAPGRRPLRTGRGPRPAAPGGRGQPAQALADLVGAAGRQQELRRGQERDLARPCRRSAGRSGRRRGASRSRRRRTRSGPAAPRDGGNTSTRPPRRANSPRPATSRTGT